VAQSVDVAQATLPQPTSPVQPGAPSPVVGTPENVSKWREVLDRMVNSPDGLRFLGTLGTHLSAGEGFSRGVSAALNQQAETLQLRQDAEARARETGVRERQVGVQEELGRERIAVDREGLEQRRTESQGRLEVDRERNKIMRDRLNAELRSAGKPIVSETEFIKLRGQVIDELGPPPEGAAQAQLEAYERQILAGIWDRLTPAARREAVETGRFPAGGPRKAAPPPPPSPERARTPRIAPAPAPSAFPTDAQLAQPPAPAPRTQQQAAVARAEATSAQGKAAVGQTGRHAIRAALSMKDRVERSGRMGTPGFAPRAEDAQKLHDQIRAAWEAGVLTDKEKQAALPVLQFLLQHRSSGTATATPLPEAPAATPRPLP
jgi:hypothetical protein